VESHKLRPLVRLQSSPPSLRIGYIFLEKHLFPKKNAYFSKNLPACFPFGFNRPVLLNVISNRSKKNYDGWRELECFSHNYRVLVQTINIYCISMCENPSEGGSAVTPPFLPLPMSISETNNIFDILN